MTASRAPCGDRWLAGNSLRVSPAGATCIQRALASSSAVCSLPTALGLEEAPLLQEIWGGPGLSAASSRDVAVSVVCAPAGQQQRELPRGRDPCGTPTRGRTDRQGQGTAGGQCELVQRAGTEQGPAAQLGHEGPQPQHSGVDGAAGTASSQPPRAVVQLRGDSAGPHSSVQLRFQQLIFREADV